MYICLQNRVYIPPKVNIYSLFLSKTFQGVVLWKFSKNSSWILSVWGAFCVLSSRENDSLALYSRELCAWSCLQEQFVEGRWEQHSYLSYLFELVLVNVGENVVFWLRNDLESHSTVVVLQWGDVVVAYRKLSSCIYLVADVKKISESFCRHTPAVLNPAACFLLAFFSTLSYTES